MSKTEQSRKRYNKIASNYDNTHDGIVTRPMKQMLINAVEVQSGQAVLDVACGTGDLIVAISKKANIKAYGIDIAEKMINVASESNRSISFKVAPAYPLQFDSDSMDIITVSAAFHHFEEPQKFADECKRVLRTGGKVYIGEFNIPSIARVLMNIFAPIVRTGDVKIYSKTELAAFFIKAGLITKSVLNSGSLMVMVFEK